MRMARRLPAARDRCASTLPAGATRLVWLGGELTADHDGGVGDLLDALHLQRQQELGPKLRILEHLLPQLLDRFARLLDDGVAVEPDSELHRRPVAREVGDLADRTERDGVNRAVLMPELHRAQGDPLDRAPELAGVDVFAHSEGVVRHEEDARDDVLDEGLATKRDRKSDYPEAREQRADIDPDRGEYDQHSDCDSRAE